MEGRHQPNSSVATRQTTLVEQHDVELDSHAVPRQRQPDEVERPPGQQHAEGATGRRQQQALCQ
jgi:hypothetical protein